MADLEFNQQDIINLAQKLSTLQPVLSPKERSLLLAIFAAAADRAKPSGPAEGATLPEAAISGQIEEVGAEAGYEATLDYFKQQLLNAYIPGNSFDSATQGGRQANITELHSPTAKRHRGPQPAAKTRGPAGIQKR